MCLGKLLPSTSSKSKRLDFTIDGMAAVLRMLKHICVKACNAARDTARHAIYFAVFSSHNLTWCLVSKFHFFSRLLPNRSGAVGPRLLDGTGTLHVCALSSWMLSFSSQILEVQRHPASPCTPLKFAAPPPVRACSASPSPTQTSALEHACAGLHVRPHALTSARVPMHAHACAVHSLLPSNCSHTQARQNPTESPMMRRASQFCH